MTRSVAGRVVALVVAALSALLAGCAAPSDADVIRQAVHEVYDESEGVTDAQRTVREARDAAVLEWAAEAGHQEPLTGAELRELQAEGGDPYGPTTLTFWNFYQEWLATIEEQLRSDVRDSLTMAEVQAFYDEHPELFERQDPILVTVVPWNDGRAGDSYSLTIDEDSVRRLQEANDLLVAAALELEEGEQVVVDLPDGSQLQVTCESRTDGGLVPFDEVVQAASSQLATQRYAEELERRTGG